MNRKTKTRLISKPRGNLNAVLGVLAIASTIFTFYLYRASASSRIVEVALAEVGYHESGSNCTKYGPCEEWCANFASWVYRKAGQRFIATEAEGGYGGWRIPYTGNVKSWFQAHGKWTDSDPSNPPKPGDVFYKVGHVGIVVSADSNHIYTVDGNSSDQVRKVTYSYGEIQGYGHFDTWGYGSRTEDLPTPALDIGIGKDGVWALGGNGEAYRWNGSDWSHGASIGGSGGKAISVSSTGPWLVSNVGNIYRYVRTSSGSNWVSMQGNAPKAKDIAVSPGGAVWIAAESDGQEWVWNGSKDRPKWSNPSGGGLASRLAIYSFPWKLVNSGSIYYRSTGGEWKRVSGALAGGDIGIGANNSVWGIESGKSVIRYEGTWEYVQGGGTDIAVDSIGVPWKISDGKVYRYMR